MILDGLANDERRGLSVSFQAPIFLTPANDSSSLGTPKAICHPFSRIAVRKIFEEVRTY